MDGLVVNDRAYNNMLLRYSEKPFFSVCISASRDCFEENMKDVLILMNRYYPSFTIVDEDNNSQERWEDVILNKTLEFGEDIEFNTPIYYQVGSEIKRSCMDENGISLSFDINHSNEEILILFFRANGYTNKNYLEHYSAEKGWCKKNVDQSSAAKINRDNLSNFLIRLEKLLGEIVEYESSAIHEKYTYRYGIKEDAVLDNLPS